MDCKKNRFSKKLLMERLEEIRVSYCNASDGARDAYCYSGADRWETFEHGKTCGMLEAIENLIIELDGHYSRTNK